MSPEVGPCDAELQVERTGRKQLATINHRGGLPLTRTLDCAKGKLAVRRLLISAAFAVSGAIAAEGPPAPDSPEATQFGYPSPEAALAALRERPGVSIYQQGGWTIADDKLNFSLWSFTPPNHPAHPTAIKRVIVKTPNGDISVTMIARCGAEKSACDKLIAEFRAQNDRIGERIRKEQGGQ